MTSHTRKRQFQPSSQPSITSYFDRTADGQSTATSKSSRSQLSPPLPDHVQSRLINVGMRVRKSVPEGYKTHKTLGFPEPAQTNLPPPSSAPAAYGRSRELMPYCAIHSTGGIDVQSQSGSGLTPPALTYSQGTAGTASSFGSASSSAASSMNSRKRTYDDDAEDDMDAYFDDQEDGAVGVNPGSAQSFNRPMARAKGKTKSTSTTPSNVRGIDFDEEDAAFLQPMDVDA